MTTETVDPNSILRQVMISMWDKINKWQLDQLGFSPRLTTALMHQNGFKTVGDVRAREFKKLPGIGEKLWDEWIDWGMDPQRLRVYAADEVLIRIAKPLPSLEKLRAFTARLCEDPVIKARYPTARLDYLPKVTNSEDGNATGAWDYITDPKGLLTQRSCGLS